MITALYVFARSFVRRRAVWVDAELWLSIVVAAAAGYGAWHSPVFAAKIASEATSLLELVGILTGFVLTTLAFYVSTSHSIELRRDRRQLLRIVEAHIQTLLTLFALIVWLLLVWVAGSVDSRSQTARTAQIAIFAFLLFYATFQLVNHSLLVWWWVARGRSARPVTQQGGTDGAVSTAVETSVNIPSDTSRDRAAGSADAGRPLVSLDVSRHEKCFAPAAVAMVLAFVMAIGAVAFDQPWWRGVLLVMVAGFIVEVAVFAVFGVWGYCSSLCRSGQESKG